MTTLSSAKSCSDQCLCGSIRYRMTQEPLSYYACHCTDCQRRTGSAFALSMLFLRSALVVDAGLTPMAHLWTRSAQSWVRIPDDIAQFETQPESPKKLLELWRNKNRTQQSTS